MRRFLTISFITLAIFAGATSMAPTAYAQYEPPTESTATAKKAVTSVKDSNTGANTPAAQKELPSDGYSQVMIWIMSLFAWLVGVAAITLNAAVYYTVVTMGDYIHKLSAIGVAWRILRDIGNIVLIFGFLAIGITTILDVDLYGSVKKMLPMLLIVAVFLNFSLFISEAIIDGGNLFATQFYTQINGGELPTSFSLSKTSDEGISSKLMNQLGLQSLYDVNNSQVKTDIFEGTNTWIVGFLGILLFIVTAFVMFSLAFILIARFVILIFLIILSPIGFAGLAVPKLSSLAHKWWSKLFEQTITAPVLLLMLYVALAVITDANFLTGFKSTGGGWLGFVNNNNVVGFAGVLLSFLVAMGLLLAVVILAKQLSAFGAGWATKTASKLSGAALVAGGAGWLGRRTVGMAGNYSAKKLRGTAFGRTFVGRGIAGTLEKRVAGASFDMRNTGLGKTVAGYGLDLGKGQTGGYKTALEARVKSYEAAAAGIQGRKMTKEEEAAIKEATSSKEVAENTRNKAKNEYDAIVAENTRQKAEQGFATNEIELASLKEKLDRAEKDFVTRNIEAEKLQKNINDSISKKGAQEEYAKSLKRWGKIPIFGTAAAEAAGRVKSSAGKTKNQIAIEAFMVKAQEAASAGQTTIPTATATTPIATPPPTGGTPKP